MMDGKCFRWVMGTDWSFRWVQELDMEGENDGNMFCLMNNAWCLYVDFGLIVVMLFMFVKMSARSVREWGIVRDVIEDRMLCRVRWVRWV